MRRSLQKFLCAFPPRLFLCAGLIAFQMAAMAAVLFWAAFRSAAAFALFWGGSLALALWVAAREESGSYKTAWILVILGLPPAGALLWLTWGGRGPSRGRRKALRRAKEHQTALFLPDAGELEELTRRHPGLGVQAAYLWRISGFGPFDRTQVDYCPLGESQFQAMLRELPQARRFILLEYFILAPGEMWDSILLILRRKAREGVEVRVIWDDLGCIRTLPPGTRRQLEEWGISTLVYNPLGPGIDPGLNYRDHRKICVVDGRVGICGGVNLADEYINKKRLHGHWKDTAVVLRGPGVWSLTRMFLQLWCAGGGSPMGEPERYRHPWPLDGPDAPQECPGFVQPFCDSPLDRHRVAENAYLQLVNRARRYVWITTPYLILDSSFLTALCTAAQSGVQVRVLCPRQGDRWFVHVVTRSYYPPLLRAGVEIWEYTPGFIHAKMAVSDGEGAIVGTANLDFRSLYLHHECAVAIWGGPAVGSVAADIQRTLEKSQRVTLEELTREPWPKRLAAAFLRLFAPLM